jgi:hypothetical protein
MNRFSQGWCEPYLFAEIDTGTGYVISASAFGDLDPPSPITYIYTEVHVGIYVHVHTHVGSDAEGWVIILVAQPAPSGSRHRVLIRHRMLGMDAGCLVWTWVTRSTRALVVLLISCILHIAPPTGRDRLAPKFNASQRRHRRPHDRTLKKEEEEGSRPIPRSQGPEVAWRQSTLALAAWPRPQGTNGAAKATPFFFLSLQYYESRRGQVKGGLDVRTVRERLNQPVEADALREVDPTKPGRPAACPLSGLGSSGGRGWVFVRRNEQTGDEATRQMYRGEERERERE